MYSSSFVPGRIVITLVLLTTQAACTPTSDPEAANTVVPAVEAVHVVDVQDQPMVKDAMNTDEQLDFARQDLVTRLGIDASEITSASSSPVVWRSGAMGCPQPGFSYTQALINGVSIELSAANTLHRYHAISGGKPFYCPQERAESPASGLDVD